MALWARKCSFLYTKPFGWAKSNIFEVIETVADVLLQQPEPKACSRGSFPAHTQSLRVSGMLGERKWEECGRGSDITEWETRPYRRESIRISVGINDGEDVEVEGLQNRRDGAVWTIARCHFVQKVKQRRRWYPFARVDSTVEPKDRPVTSGAQLPEKGTETVNQPSPSVTCAHAWQCEGNMLLGTLISL